MFQALTQFIGFCCVLAAWWYDGQVHQYTYYIALAALVSYFYKLPGGALDMLTYAVTGAVHVMGSYKESFEANERKNGAAIMRLWTLFVLVVFVPLTAWFYYSVLTDLLAFPLQ